ncbi:MAG: ABC transporter ATP-binding protein [Synergistaceae bacterium]|nr:ABC transporter ATP-binding protein [Synergistota bacterium]NLM72145.1 ABC transporter ATP-binding protein [Synergistaceae bacterium]
MDDYLLKVDDLSVIYKTDLEIVYAVNNISFSMKKGDTLGLVGETGAGKTTTALTLMRLLPGITGKVSTGSVHFEGKNLLELPEGRMQSIRGEKISMIFQDPMTSLNPVFTVNEQISETLELHNSMNRTKEEIQDRVDEVLSMVGISPDRKKEYPHQFSGGMKQRVVIAMALACEPMLLIADEPTTALDVTIQEQVLFLMRDLRDRLNTAMIMITHDLGIVAQTCDNVAVMYAGEIVEYGTAYDIFKGERHHPYTTGLFNSIPDLESESKRLAPVPGLIPDPTDLPGGCKFHPRCPHVMEICERVHPSYSNNGSHRVLCHLYAGGD